MPLQGNLKVFFTLWKFTKLPLEFTQRNILLLLNTLTMFWAVLRSIQTIAQIFENPMLLAARYYWEQTGIKCPV